MKKPTEVLRILIPVDGFTPEQRARATTLGNRIEGKLAAALAKGTDPDRILDWVEGYFPGRI